MNPREKGDKRLQRLGTDLLASLPDGIAMVVMYQDAASYSLQEAWRGGVDGLGSGEDAGALVSACLKRQRSVLVHHAEKGTQVRGVEERTFQSALCVPVLGSAGNVLGIIFLASAQPGTFNKEHRYSVERVARDFISPLAALSRSRSSRGREEVEPERKSLFGVSELLLTVAFALMFLTMSYFAPSKETPQAVKPAVSPEERAQIEEVAGEFLERLQSRKYGDAWMLFDSSLKERWSPDSFFPDLREWREDGDNAKILKGRRVSRVTFDEKGAKVVLLESSVPGDRGHWTWELKKVGEEWYLVGLDGPVPSPRGVNARF